MSEKLNEFLASVFTAEELREVSTVELFFMGVQI